MNPETERKMVIGLIASTEFYKKIRPIINPDLIVAPVARTIAEWCNEYYDKYRKAPGLDIAEIYYEKLKSDKRLDKDIAEEIEEDLLPELSEEWEEYGIEVDSLVDSVTKYFKYQKLERIKSGIEICLESNDVEEAEKLVDQYKQTTPTENIICLDNKEQVQEALSRVFAETYEPLIKWSGALGEFWNHSMVRGGFVAFLAPEKRGKTALMIEAASLASKQKNKVAVFQAGDMTETQQLRRMAINLTKTPDKEKYIGKIMIPTLDCFFNQIDDCSNSIRECNHGVFEDKGWQDVSFARNEITKEDIEEALKYEPDYKPCYNCLAFHKNKWAMPYLKEHEVKDILSEAQAMTAFERFFINKNRQLRISTHDNGSLSVKKMEEILDTWQVQDNWIPDVIILDYADLLASSPGASREERHRQNDNWKALRGLNQKINCLLITATQADAKSYEKNTLSLSNFSEDKRKFAHATAFYGLNQDFKGREKGLGLMRINELLLREDSFDINRQVTLLQAMTIGKPVLGSYW